MVILKTFQLCKDGDKKCEFLADDKRFFYCEKAKSWISPSTGTIERELFSPAWCPLARAVVE